MNLPASAIEFLPAYRGIYYGHEDLFAPSTARKLPLVHVHCFSIKSEDGGHAQDICDRISRQLGVEMRHGNAENDYEIAIHDVRDVAPKKRMYCASFRLPAEVAFAPRS